MAYATPTCQGRAQPPGGNACGPSEASESAAARVALGAVPQGLLAQALVQPGLGGLQVGDHLKVAARDPAHVDLVDVHQAQQLLHGLGHRAPAFVAGTPALGYSDLAPELLLVQAEAVTDVAGVRDSFHFDVISTQLNTQRGPGRACLFGSVCCRKFRKAYCSMTSLDASGVRRH